MASPVTMVIGESDTGKTTLVTALANALSARHPSVAVVDADLGQSEIGPPTTIGLGRVRAPLRRLGDAEVIGLHFVGTTSPAGNLLGAVVGARRMLDRARALGFERVVIDTSGLVAGALGRTLKRAKIDVTDAALVIALERAGECGHIVAACAGAERPHVLRLPASPAVRPRSADERRRHRQERLQAYFAAARSLTLPLDRVAVRAPSGEALGPHHAADGLELVLVGLEDRARTTLGLGIIRGVDFDRAVLLVDTNVPEAEVSAVAIGRETYPA